MNQAQYDARISRRRSFDVLLGVAGNLKDQEEKFGDDSIAFRLNREEHAKLQEMCLAMREKIQVVRVKFGMDDEQLKQLANGAEKLTNLIFSTNGGLCAEDVASSIPSSLNSPKQPLLRTRERKRRSHDSPATIQVIDAVIDAPNSPEADAQSSSDEVRQPSKRHKKKASRKSGSLLPSELYCRSCGETQTCEWRRGPDGFKSLCNACGIHYAKVLKKEASLQDKYVPKQVRLDMLLN